MVGLGYTIYDCLAFATLQQLPSNVAVTGVLESYFVTLQQPTRKLLQRYHGVACSNFPERCCNVTTRLIESQFITSQQPPSYVAATLPQDLLESQFVILQQPPRNVATRLLKHNLRNKSTSIIQRKLNTCCSAKFNMIINN